jgi:hypothetical protein
MATLSATGNDKVQAGFAPLVSEFIHIDFNDVDAIKAPRNNNNTCKRAILMAASLASAPELPKKALSILDNLQSFSAKVSWWAI